ncbi:MAG: hypothetical protein QW379_04260 [Thermoplasmata archaeon]
MSLSRDRKGRVPFALVAVVILICSAITAAYMQRAAIDGSGGDGEGEASIETFLPSLRRELNQGSEWAIQRALCDQLGNALGDGYQSIWRVEESFRRYFTNSIRSVNIKQHFGRDAKATTLELESASVTATPRSIRTLNRFGMEVWMSCPAALRASSVVNVTFCRSDGVQVSKRLDIVTELESWYPYVLSQAARMRRECAPEGLVELFMREMFGGYLERALPDLRLKRYLHPRALFPDTLGYEIDGMELPRVFMDALNDSMYLLERIFLATAPAGSVQLPDSSNLSALLPYAPLYPELPRSARPGLTIELARYGRDVYPYLAVKGARPLSSFHLVSESGWILHPEVEFKLLRFAGEELGVDPIVFEVFVNGLYELAVGPANTRQFVHIAIPVHLDFHVVHEENVRGKTSESAEHHCAIEDIHTFREEYSYLYSAPSTVYVDVSCEYSTRLGALQEGFLLELSVDGEPAGLFSPEDLGPEGIELTRVPSGPHQFDVVLRLDGTEPLLGSTTKDVRDGTKVTVPAGASLENAGLWRLIFEYLRDTPPEFRMVRLFELFSRLSGYPLPWNWQGLGGNSSGSVGGLLAWGEGLDSHLSTPSGAAAASNAIGASSAKGMQAFVRISLEVIRRVEQAIGSLKLDEAGRLEAFKVMRVGVEFGYGSSGQMDKLTIKIEGNVWQRELRYEKIGGRWILVDSKSSKAWDDPTPADLKSTAVGAIGDILGIIVIAFSLYTKFIQYHSDKCLTTYETLDLAMDAVKLGLRIGQLVARIATAVFKSAGLVTGAKVALAVIGEIASVVIGALTIAQCILSEMNKFRGDPVWLEDLLADPDQSSVSFYLAVFTFAVSLASMMASILGMATVAAILGPVGLFLMALTIIVLIIFNWDAVSSMVTGNLSNEAREQAQKSVGRTLRDTLGTVALLNGMRSDETMAAARTARGAALALDRLAALSTDANLTFELQNLSTRTMDDSWAKQHQAVAVRSLRYFIITLWRQVEDGPGAEIKITDNQWSNNRLLESDVRDYLEGMTEEKAANTTISFTISGTVRTDDVGAWANSLARIGDQITKWQKKLSKAQAMSRYISEQDGVNYSNEWGYLQLRIPTSIVDAHFVTRASNYTLFRYLDMGGKDVSVSSVKTSMAGGPPLRGVYVSPGKYMVECKYTEPEIKLKKRSWELEVRSFYSYDFADMSVELQVKGAPIYLTIKNHFVGTFCLSILVKDKDGAIKGALYNYQLFNETTCPLERIYMDESWIPGFDFDDGASSGAKEVLKWSINITVGFDPDGDGEFGDWSYRNVSLAWIREEHIKVMKRQDRKSDDQLGYELEILTSNGSGGERLLWRKTAP